jgi:hypothetical protein
VGKLVKGFVWCYGGVRHTCVVVLSGFNRNHMLVCLWVKIERSGRGSMKRVGGYIKLRGKREEWT